MLKNDKDSFAIEVVGVELVYHFLHFLLVEDGVTLVQ